MPAAKNAPEDGVIRLFVDRGGAFGEECLRGAFERAKERLCPYMIDAARSSDAAVLKDRRCLGLAGMLFSPEIRKVIGSAPYPAINLSNRYGPSPECGNFLSDDREVGRVAARHLLGRGYKAVLVVTQDVVRHGEERVAGFLEVARDCKVGVIRQRFVFRAGHSAIENVRDFVEELAGVIDDYPMDTGIFATNDWVAGIVQRTLKDRFPERLHTTAVLGVDNEQQNWWYLGPLAELSSVVPAFREMGAAAIDWLIDHPGDKAAAAGLLRRFPPNGVVERASTAGGACGDPLTAQMIRWAWSQLRQQVAVGVADLAAKFHMSRRTLDRKFSEFYGRPSGEFLLDLRMDLAQHLLRSTSLPIGEISQRCGYSKQDVLTRRIRAEFGCTPKEYRVRLREGAAGTPLFGRRVEGSRVRQVLQKGP